MTEVATDPAPPDELGPRLDMLLDLFRRRLLDDRGKAKAIDELSDRLRAAEAGQFRQVLQPLVRRLVLVLDRLDAYVVSHAAGTDPDFVGSVRHELLDVLLDQGVRSVGEDCVGRPFRPGEQEAVGRVDGGEPGTVDRLVRYGYAHGDWVFRPAQVVVSVGPAG